MATNDVNSLKTARPTEGCRSVHQSKDDPEMQLPSPFKKFSVPVGFPSPTTETPTDYKLHGYILLSSIPIASKCLERVKLCWETLNIYKFVPQRAELMGKH